MSYQTKGNDGKLGASWNHCQPVRQHAGLDIIGGAPNAGRASGYGLCGDHYNVNNYWSDGALVGMHSIGQRTSLYSRTQNDRQR
jgi:hypothetical protein